MARSTILEDVNIERKARPLAPGTSLQVNSDTGSDLNDGFNAPVATIDKLHDILGRYNFNDANLSISITGTALAASSLDLNFAGISNIRKIELSFGTRTGSVSIRNAFNELQILASIFDGDLAFIGVFDFLNLTVGSTVTFSNKTSPVPSLIIANGNKFSLETPTFTNYNAPAADFATIFDIINFQFDPLNSPTAVNTLVKTFGVCRYMQLENGGSAITGQVLDVSLSDGIIIDIDGWAFTGTVPNAYPDFYIEDGQAHHLNLPTFVDDTAAGIGGLVTGDLYKTATGDLKVKL